MKTILCLVGVMALGAGVLWYGGYLDGTVNISPKGQETIDQGVQEGKAQLDRGADLVRGKVHELTAPSQDIK